jgi:alkanesulfonate monooxygenase SsuD/methylene tetrahydromethanopterin reductase-like flavin-dependent oxidoreductase (luciferase family)
VKLGLALPMFDLETGRTLGLAEVAEIAAEAESVGFDSLWVMDHYWLENVPAVTGAHDPLVTLAYVAARVRRAELGTLVACNGFRPVGQLAREAVAVADAAPGRFVLGLGCGWEESEFNAFGYPFDHRVARLEETLTVLPGLLRGERQSLDGRYVRIRDAVIANSGAPPPRLWIAAFGSRMLGLCARFADGWNTAWHDRNTSRFRGELQALDHALGEQGRARETIEVSVGLWVLPVDGAERDAALARADALKPAHADPSWPLPARDRMISGHPQAIADVVRAYAAAGADHVILNVAPTPFSLFDRGNVRRAGRIIDALRG